MIEIQSKLQANNLEKTLINSHNKEPEPESPQDGDDLDDRDDLSDDDAEEIKQISKIRQEEFQKSIIEKDQLRI